MAACPALPVAREWFRIRAAGDSVTLIDEPHVHGLLQANTWLVRGRDRDLLVDSGLGIASLRSALAGAAPRDPVLVLTHAHLDHMGSAHEFPDCWAHPAEPAGNPPPGSLHGPALRAELKLSETLPDLLISAVPDEAYDAAAYRLKPARVTRHLGDGDVVDLGGPAFTVLHLPGHSPGSIALLDEHNGALFSGDVLYDDVLLDSIAGADPRQYAASLGRLRDLPVRIVYPGHGPTFGPGRMRAIIDRYLVAVQHDKDVRA